MLRNTFREPKKALIGSQRNLGAPICNEYLVHQTPKNHIFHEHSTVHFFPYECYCCGLVPRPQTPYHIVLCYLTQILDRMRQPYYGAPHSILTGYTFA